jgi:hypothetical protein
VKVVATVITLCKSGKVVAIPKRLVKIYATVYDVGGSNPIVDTTSKLVPKRLIGAPPIDRK